MMATVFLGNTSPVDVPLGIQVHVNGESSEEHEAQPSKLHKTIVVIDTPDHDSEGKKIPMSKKLLEIRNAFKLHSADEKAAWVESHDDGLAKLLAEDFDVEIGRPKDWDGASAKASDAEASEDSQEPVSEPWSAYKASLVDKVQVGLSDEEKH